MAPALTLSLRSFYVVLKDPVAQTSRILVEPHLIDAGFRKAWMPHFCRSGHPVVTVDQFLDFVGPASGTSLTSMAKYSVPAAWGGGFARNIAVKCTFTKCVGLPFRMLPGQMPLRITVKELSWLVQLLQDYGTTFHPLCFVEPQVTLFTTKVFKYVGCRNSDHV